MDKGNAPLSVQVRESIWKGFKELAEQERRKINEVVVDVLEWSVTRLIEAGSLTHLLGRRIDQHCGGKR
jgi:hypothetical protein